MFGMPTSYIGDHIDTLGRPLLRFSRISLVIRIFVVDDGIRIGFWKDLL